MYIVFLEQFMLCGTLDKVGKTTDALSADGLVIQCINVIYSIHYTMVYKYNLSYFSKNGLKKNRRKNYKHHLRSKNYEVCTAVARCFPNILDVIVLENVNLFSDKIGRPPLSSYETELDFCHQSLIYLRCQQ
jgi:hypothetical protein